MIHEPLPSVALTDPVIFEDIDGQLIEQVARQCKGSAGPSGLDACAWRRTSTAFKQASWDLCKAISIVAQYMCTHKIEAHCLSALVASCLISLNKNPGIRPIGVSEVLRRIIGKAVMKIVKHDVVRAAGALQVCSGLEGGCEAVIHARNAGDF